ncbi:hypothetical protein HDU76_005102, partial [Blyttiomyces sp. JEL0837]
NANITLTRCSMIKTKKSNDRIELVRYVASNPSNTKLQVALTLENTLKHHISLASSSSISRGAPKTEFMSSVEGNALFYTDFCRLVEDARDQDETMVLILTFDVPSGSHESFDGVKQVAAL